MLHTAHHAIKARLTMWKVFFETGYDGAPDGATDDEYGLDQLVDLAMESDAIELHDLASVVELMGWNYLLCMDNDIFNALMSEDPMVPVAGAVATARVAVATAGWGRPGAVSMAELEAVLYPDRHEPGTGVSL